MAIISCDTANHYKWGHGCDGWILAPTPDLLVIEERMPPRTAEQRHFHSMARQFFYVLAGELSMECAGDIINVPANCGIGIAPGEPHQARNDGATDVRFLVVSSPTTRGDRTNLDP